ncbi:hypothetical protein P3T76_012844 [Phytophthora citrophthora]|uniref:Uncharacterized protein n=1 Tax=Phytophthora citrophthora TaxID=4793 RepID=A0AAD9G4H9_9STRA|nr:hypothetical protein P3T76_012844 [Phytophthora citrophthora]
MYVTCDNTLELPHYWKALCWKEQHDEHESNEKLEEELVLLLGKKLQDAVEYSSGYGLDGTTAVAGVLGGKAKDNEGGMTKVGESYDSLGLPALSEGQSAVDLPTEDVPPSPQTSETEQGEAEPIEPDVKPEPTALSPRPDESYEEDYDDWEEESMA